MKRKWAIYAVIMSMMLCCTACTDRVDTELSPDVGVNEIIFNNEEKQDPGKAQASTGNNTPPEETDPADDTETQSGTKQGQQGSYEKITSQAKIKSFGGTIQVGDSGYELYTYVKESAQKYASTVNKTAGKLKGTSQVYDIVVPTSIGITLPDNKVKKVNSSNQKNAIRSIYQRLNKNVTEIDLYDTLMQHRTEYIYFRTDHHWTHKGAYYAYQKFCQEKGITPHKLSDYTRKSFGTYLGSFYLDTNKSKQLRKDKLQAYFPVNNKRLQMAYTTQKGAHYKGPVIYDGTNYSTSLKYCVFIGGDNPYSVIKNKKIKDGSSCIVVKESYGNAFIPYLTDHYQKIYVIDYRYWNGSVTSLAKREKVEDVIFINNISMTRNAYLLGKLAQVQ